MTKNIFIYIVIALFVGTAIWLFVQKSKKALDNSDLGNLVASEEPSPSPQSDDSSEAKWVKLPNGLQVLDTLVGYGREAREGDIVAAHYTGTLENGTKFDSSYDRGQPYSFILGGGMVIKGWDTGLVGMKVGGKRKLIIPSDLGYGPRDMGAIPPNSTLYFDIELIGVETPKK